MSGTPLFARDTLLTCDGAGKAAKERVLDELLAAKDARIKHLEELLAQAHFALIEARSWNWLDEDCPPPEDIIEQISGLMFRIKAEFQ